MKNTKRKEGNRRDVKLLIKRVWPKGSLFLKNQRCIKEEGLHNQNLVNKMMNEYFDFGSGVFMGNETLIFTNIFIKMGPKKKAQDDDDST